MTFLAPEWLALLPVLLVAGWFVPRLHLFRPLRLLGLLLVTAVLAEPRIRKYEDGMDLWVLLDRSDSTGDLVDRGLPEWRKLLEKARPGGEYRVRELDYAAEVVQRGTTGAELYERNRHLTRTRLAVESALAMADPRRRARVLLFTDGFSTEPLEGLPEKLVGQGVSLDYRLVRDASPVDYRLTRFQLPDRAQAAEPFLIDIEVRANAEGKVPVLLRRNNRDLKTIEVELKNGVGTARFADRIPMTGAHRYEALIQPPQADQLGNNRSEAWIEIAGGPRVLLLTKYQGDPLVETLQRQGFSVEALVLPGATPAIGQLSGAKAVILNNVPAFELPEEFLRALPFYVREQAGSLLMAGGRQSFASGGYFQSPVDELLPVSMEMKVEHRKLSVAMAIVMDRSGSMGMTVAGGLQKMDLANEGAANAIGFLGAQDLLTVFAVDSDPHEMVPLQQVGPNRAKMESAVRRIKSMGGGIFVYQGLKGGWESLKNAEVGQRHLILFSDAADSEEPGSWEALVDDMVANNCTVSVIALGTRADVDAKLLEDIATRGKGRIFFTADAHELPSIFSQETVAVARSAFIKDPTAAQPGSGWFEVSAQPMEWMQGVDGYNLCYLREWASQALLTKDEYAAPLVAFGQRGLGRTAAVTFPLGGESSERVRSWPHYGDFAQTLTRWLMGEELPPGLGLRTDLRGTALGLDLLYDSEWEPKIAEKAPRVMAVIGPAGTPPRELTWRRLSPGHYRAEAELIEGDMARGVIQVGPHALPFGPLSIGASAEWAFDGARMDELRNTAAASGGGELLDLASAWRHPPTKAFVDVRQWFWLGALGLLLLDALITRTGWGKMPEIPLPKRIARRPLPKAKKAARPAIATAQTAAAPGPKEPAPPPSTEQPSERESRFARAKRRQ